MKHVKPRDYQVEAASWALRRRGATIVMPTGSGKTLIAVLWSKELIDRGEARKILFLEPTRILVEQVSRYVASLLGVPVRPIHGKYPKQRRRMLWREAMIAVATPETALMDREEVIRNGFDAVVVDECHHTTGKDAYAEFMASTRFRYRLGLSAYIPPQRAAEIERYIGPIRTWSWSDDRIRRYVPPWIGEIYEAELNEAEERLLRRLEELRLMVEGRDRGLVNMAIRWFVRDGALALEESLGKPTRLASLLRGTKPLLGRGVRPLHKLEALKRILRDHEGFSKAIVFVDRVVVAQAIAAELQAYRPVVIQGKRGGVDSRRALEEARRPDTRLIVSTSAGEEGMDLPEADLLVIWSNVASPLRFIQRHGRIIRLTGVRKPKFVAYIVTPDTPDMDSLVDSLETARRLGVDVPVGEEVLEALWRRTSRSRLLSLLEGSPMPLEWLAEVAGMPRDMAEEAVRRLARHGEVVYIYTHLGRTYAASSDLGLLEEQFAEYLDPDPELRARIKAYIDGGETVSLTASFEDAYKRLSRLLEKHGWIDRIFASLEVPLGTGAYRLLNLVYSFRIGSTETLLLVLRNLYSARRFHRYL